tara:strand:- start:482 stop:955 length:474 start_codon:yes stop_codon:yes gene_type:complete
MSRETELKNFFRKSKTRKRLGLKPGTSIGPAGASIVSDDGMRLKNTSGDPNKKLKTLRQLADSLDTPLPTAGVASAIRKAQGKAKSELTEEQIKNILKEAEQKKDIEGSPHQGVKTDQEGNPILSIAKGGMVKKKTKKKKSKVAGRLAKRGYGAARK